MTNTNHTVKTDRKCSFAFPGTYGHECGSVSVIVAVKKTTMTHSGLSYMGRCAVCAKHKGGENAGIIRMEAESGQVNDWNGRYNEN